MQLYYNAAKGYKIPSPSETVGRLKYDTRELRLRPEGLTKWYQDRGEEATERQRKGNNAQAWPLYREQLGKTLDQIYPIRKTQT